MSVKRALTLDEAVEMIEADEDVADVVLLPPENHGEETDEDEVEVGNEIPVDVPGEIELHFFRSESPNREEVMNDKPQSKRRKTEKCQPDWKNTDKYEKLVENGEGARLEETHPDLAEKSPIQLFLMFFTDEIALFIAEESNRYSSQKNNHRFQVTADDIMKFVGVFLLSGYHSLPQQQLYWSKDEDVRVQLVSRAIPRNRFLDIKRYLHLANNDNLNATDKIAKVRPYLEKVNERLLQFGVWERDLSIDEQMLPYFGRSSAKMFMKNKPVKFGYKLWVVCSSSGYPFRFAVYIGKEKNREDDGVALGARVVQQLLQILEDPSHHTVTFDSFFTSYDLLVNLADKGIKATGTVRENRLKKCPLRECKIMKTEARGSMDFQCDGKILAVRWNDNKPVTVASNFDALYPLRKQRRFSQSEKAYVQVEQPALIHNYNQRMGGVDIFDRFLSDYRPTIRGKKWWFPFFTHGLNICVAAAWRIHATVGGAMPHLEFRRYITRSLLQAAIVGDRPGPSTTPLQEVRYDGVGHIPEKGISEGRCKLCLKNTWYECSKCHIRLHQKCFFVYHDQNQ